MPDQRGIISIWVFRSKLKPEDAHKDVLKDLCGVESYDLDFLSGVQVDEPTPVSKLIGELPYAFSYLDAAVAAASQCGIDTAFGVISELEFKFDAEQDVTGPIADDPVFIGFFSWHR